MYYLIDGEINERFVVVHCMETFTHHFTMVRIECLLDQREVVFSQTALKTQQMREHPRFILKGGVFQLPNFNVVHRTLDVLELLPDDN